MRLVFILWEALSFHGLPVEASPALPELPAPEPEAGALTRTRGKRPVREMRDRKAGGGPLVSVKLKSRNERNAV